MKILKFPNEKLKTVAVSVSHNDDLSFIDKMLSTMKSEGGCGLAATQVGINKRVIVYSFNGNDFEMINPEYKVLSHENYCMGEGCLSIPGAGGFVERPKSILVQYIDRDFKRQEREVFDEESSIIQHEIDHLNGVLFIDRLSNNEKRKNRKILKALSKKAKK